MNQTAHPILIGCSGWSYADWVGAFYPEGTSPGEYLEFYADHFPIVEVDSSFYRPPSPKMVRGWYDRTPDDFRFVLKVPRTITHEKRLRDCQEDVDEFVRAILPLREKLYCALLQLGYFNRSAFGSLDEFLEVLDPFLARWPHGRVPLALETRNPKWVGPELLDVLRKHNTAFALTEQKWMPTPAEINSLLDPITGPFAFIRLVGDREAIEKQASVWNQIVFDRSRELAETAEVIRDLSSRVPVVVFANNHYAGFAPETVAQLRRLLDLPEPSPPDRPRTTLFD